MTESYVRHDTFMCHVTCSCVRRDSIMCVRVYVCLVCACVGAFTHTNACSESCVWVCMCVFMRGTWLNHVCGVTHCYTLSHTQCNTLHQTATLCNTLQHTHVCDLPQMRCLSHITHSCLSHMTQWVASHMYICDYVPWSTYTCRIRVTWPILMCHVTYSCVCPLQSWILRRRHAFVWRDSFICVTPCNTLCVTCLIHMCNTLQHTATHCNTLQHTATHMQRCRQCTPTNRPPPDAHCITHTLYHTTTDCNPTTLQCTATHCDTHTALHCHALKQHTTPRCNALPHTATHYNTLQRTATHCNALQRTAAHCSTVHYTATPCNTLQHPATRCNTLQTHMPYHEWFSTRINTERHFPKKPMSHVTRLQVTSHTFMSHARHTHTHSHTNTCALQGGEDS